MKNSRLNTKFRKQINTFSGIREKVNDIFISITQGSGLKAKTARGGFWLGTATAMEQSLRFIRNMILTRLLAPEAFGLMAIVLAINGFFDGFTSIGIGSSILQNPEAYSKKYLNGAWWLSFLRGTGIYIIAFFSAPFIADFYGNQQLINLMRVGFLSMFFNGLISCNIFIAQKQMNFKKLVVISQGGGLFGISIAIILAFIMENVWALVLGFTVESAAICLLSYIICPFRPGINFDKVHLSSMFKYTRRMFGLPILTFIFLNGDVFVVGKMLPMSDLGIYSMALNLARAPFSIISNIVSQLLLPVFSEIQNNIKKINHYIYIITMGMLYVGVPAVIFIIFFSQELLTLIYGSSYSVVNIPFNIILCSEVLKVIGIPIATFYLMSGRPELHRLFTGIRALLMVSLIYFGVKALGLVGASIVVLTAISISYGFQMNRLHGITHLNILEYSSIFLKALILSLCVVVLYVPMYIVYGKGSLATIIAGLAGCVIAIVIGIKLLIKEIKYPEE
jgi:lipopolysaccharide exporter